MNLLQHIAQSRHLLRKSELKVADHVLLDPAAVMHSSMADLAHSVGISEPTIVRFCRAIGCTGFQDFKLRLAHSLALGTPATHSVLRASDETGYVQPTKSELRQVRGTNSIYHNNGIQTWLVKANGETENVEVS